MKTYAIIPARLDSKRLPGKMLLDETGIPLVLHTYFSIVPALKEGIVDDIFVATQDEEIKKVCKDSWVPVIDVGDAKCGTHRCLLAAKNLGPCNIINVQGDYPNIDYKMLDWLKSHMLINCEICSIYYGTNDKSYAEKPSHVNVVTDLNNYAHYFSRSLIPYNNNYWKIHVGVYGIPYKHQTFIVNKYGLPYYKNYDNGEGLEQLMWLDDGFKIKMFCGKDQVEGIDTREDYERFKNSIGR